jgi:hypothetical protein
MKIEDYIAQNKLARIDQAPDLKPPFVPPAIQGKFDSLDGVEYYGDQQQVRTVGVCRARNLFVAHKRDNVAVHTGALDKDYPALDGF